MATRMDSRQSRQRSILDQISNAADLRLDKILNLMNDELTMPLRMRANSTPDLILNIDSIIVETIDGSDGHGRKRSIPPISNTLPTFTGATITFPSTSGGSITTSGTFSGGPYTLTIGVGNWRKVLISLTATGAFVLTFGTEGASESAAGLPGTSSGTYAIGYVAMQNVGGTIQNVTNARIYQFVGGGGSGEGGSGNELLETIKNMMADSTYDLVTPNIARSDAATLISSFGGGASYDLVENAFKFASASDSITSVNMLDTQEFLGAFKDVSKVQLTAFWKSTGIDTAAVYEVSRNGGAHYSTVTMSRVGSNTETYSGEYEWTREEEDAANQSQVTTSTSVELTNIAGTKEAMAQKLTLSTRTRVTKVGLYLSKLGSPTGSYQIKLMQDDGSGNYPSLTAQIAASAQLDVSALTGSAALYEFDMNQTLDAGTYHIVLETDSTYKGVFSAGVTAMRVHSDGSGSPAAAKFDSGVWSADTVGRLAHVLTAWTESYGLANEYDVANATASVTLNSTTQQQLSQAFTLSAPELVKRARLYMNRAAAAVGNMYVSIVKDSAGSPSASAADILCESNAVSISGIGTGNQTVLVDLPKVALPAGTYHIVIRTDAAYKAGTMDLGWRDDETSPPAPNGKRYDGATWSALASAGTFTYRLDGRDLDVRVRITSSAGSKLLNGYGLFYDPQLAGGMSSGVKRVKRFDFLSTANTTTFALDFVPDPDLLSVYYVQAGQVFKFPSFQIDGKNLVFPSGTFYNNVSYSITLIAMQSDGTSFDNSDRNAALLAGNFLGSTDSSIDRSAAGRGIFLRRPDGTLREIAIDNNDNIVVYSI